MAASVEILGLVLVRVATFIAVLPLFSGRNLPHTVKIGLAVILSLFWWTSSMPTGQLPLAGGGTTGVLFCIAAIREVLLGGALAFGAGLFLLPMQIAGAYIAQEMGLSMSAQTDPSGQGPMSNVNQLFHGLGVLLFFGLNLHHVLLSVLHASFFSRPVGTAFHLPTAAVLLGGVTETHEAGLLIAAPVAGGLFITLLVLMTAMRTSPQLNLFSVGLPLRLAVGLVSAVVFFPEMCGLAARTMSRISNVAYW